MNNKPLEALQVVDRLTVGPVRLEPSRLIAPYTLSVGGTDHVNELIYSYEEAVFDPEERESLNLAAVIASQVALNYGLFCREMRFIGEYEELDRDFLEEMAANTAREIYVHKVLKPTGFLVGEAANQSPFRSESYLQAKIVLKAQVPRTAENEKYWRALDRRGCAVLSSGGKDSLLSFGLLNEVDGPIHPIFINESGRHWFTALNAYRYLRNADPLTARVWTNADRLFNWVLRHLPFVRSDYQRIRADIYPIRLWTVAVFLFGALPLLRKRGVGRLVIGDEYDTTRLEYYEGIPHYDGLYDQSLHFDRALTHYYAQKGWKVEQFSVLRSVTEILIEKILLERYPELQRNQVSCHAARVVESRVYPCGKCEKCRRIVSLLVALGADPGRCGYNQEQVAGCLRSLREKGIHQEAEDVEDLYMLLQSRGMLSPSATAQANRRIDSSILKIRFDDFRAPAQCIPEDLRRPLYNVFAEHSDGAVRKVKGGWADVDIIEALKAAGSF